MTFIEKFEEQQKRIVDTYGAYMYYLIINIFNVNYMSSIFDDIDDYTTVRKTTTTKEIYDELFYKGTHIGHISSSVFPCIEFYKKYRKHAKMFAKYAIEPIPGYHRILEWHDIKYKKMHCLAGGETVLHFDFADISNDDIDKFIKTCKLEKVVETTKHM